MPNLLTTRPLRTSSNDEHWNTPLVLVVLTMDGCCIVVVSILSVDPREMQWAEAALGLASLCGDLNPEDLLRLFLLMQLFKTWNLS